MANNNFYNPYGQTVTTWPQNMQYQAQYQPQNTQFAQNNSSGNLMTIAVNSEEEVNSYPVAAGTTVLLISFNLKKFWLKSTSTSGIPEPLREFPFEEKTQTPPQQSDNSVSREEFVALAESVKKLISDLGGEQNG